MSRVRVPSLTPLVRGIFAPLIFLFLRRTCTLASCLTAALLTCVDRLLNSRESCGRLIDLVENLAHELNGQRRVRARQPVSTIAAMLDVSRTTVYLVLAENAD
jgi:hypothetical protein